MGHMVMKNGRESVCMETSDDTGRDENEVYTLFVV